jgi:methionyl-tRNA synthetase
MSRTFYVTTPIYYVNDVPHIGHAYTTLAGDVLARYKRLKGFEVFFLTGTDEHGQKVEKAANAAGETPLELADRVVKRFQALWEKLDVSYSDFIRTTQERHKKGVAHFFATVEEKGDIYLGEYEDWYCTPCETFWTETQLIDYKCPDCNRPTEKLKEESYFFRMSKYQEQLLAHIEANPDFIQPKSKRNEILSFVKEGLRDLSVSRTTFKWGIPVPGNDKHIIYVWFDALTNYITALGYPDETAPRWAYWPANLHLVGKEISRFHALYWPAFLMSAGIPVPKRVYSHGWWTVEGQKMSKSLGNTLDPRTLADEFGLDALRYFLLREVPFGGDGDFSRRALISRLNVDLANDLGNLAQRTLSLVARNCDGRRPPVPKVQTEDDDTLCMSAVALPGFVGAAIERQALHEALEAVWRVVRAANGYIDRQAPWALRKTDPARMGDVLRILLHALRVVATVLTPFMPDSMSRMLDQLGVPADLRGLDSLMTALPDGEPLPAPQGIFPRHVETAA